MEGVHQASKVLCGGCSVDGLVLECHSRQRGAVCPRCIHRPQGTRVPYLRAANCHAHRTPLHCCSIPLTVQTRRRCRNHWMALPCSVLQRRCLRVHREAAFFAKEPACVPIIWRTPRHRRHHTCRWYSTTQGGAMNLTDCKMHLHGRCVAAAAAAAAAAEVAGHGHAASGKVHTCRGCSVRAGAK
jgi:hypothetical protein